MDNDELSILDLRQLTVEARRLSHELLRVARIVEFQFEIRHGIKPRTPPDELTKAESAVLAEVIKGKTNKQIADTLFVSDKTIRFHLTNIFRKRGVNRREQLIVQEHKKTTTGT